MSSTRSQVAARHWGIMTKYYDTRGRRRRCIHLSVVTTAIAFAALLPSKIVAFNFCASQRLASSSASRPSLRAKASTRSIDRTRRSTSLFASNEDDSSSSKGGDGVTFFVSPSSLTHLSSYFDDPSRDVLPPVYDKMLVSDDNDHKEEEDGGAAGAAAALSSASTLQLQQQQQPSMSDIIAAKLPALAVASILALVVGYGGNYFLESVLNLDLLTVGPLLYFFGFSVGWQVMGGDMEVDISSEDAGATAASQSAGVASDSAWSKEDDAALQFVMDRPIRLRCILETLEDANARIVTAPTNDQRDLSKANKYLKSAHTQKYIDGLRSACASIPSSSTSGQSSTTSPIKRLSAGSSRTYVDNTSFDAALSAVQDWIDAVDYAMTNDAPAFALTRPPSHHACPTRGMGGCLLNGCAIAAYYALKTYPDVKRVSILDIDAHHGNGIAACIQERPPIRYCSIHEYCKGEAASLREPRADNPRGPWEGDVGPRMNCQNVVLQSGIGWEGEQGYEHALVESALPFLKEKNPDLLLVACGLDALHEDGTSGLQLKPKDYRQIGEDLKKEFGNRIVFGLEGGYSWDKGSVLGDSVLEITSPWN